jgi:hypothetical protein
MPIEQVRCNRRIVGDNRDYHYLSRFEIAQPVSRPCRRPFQGSRPAPRTRFEPQPHNARSVQRSSARFARRRRHRTVGLFGTLALAERMAALRQLPHALACQPGCNRLCRRSPIEPRQRIPFALCAVLVTSSMVALRGLSRSLHAHFGFDPQNTLLVNADLHMAGYRRACKTDQIESCAIILLPSLDCPSYCHRTGVPADTRCRCSSWRRKSAKLLMCSSPVGAPFITPV